MGRQTERTAGVKARGGRRLNLYLTPEAVAALARLKVAHKSEAAAVNAALVGWDARMSSTRDWMRATGMTLNFRNGELTDD